MITVREALAQYIVVRRALGAKLREPAVRLGEFVDFLQRQGAEFITTELALRWAMHPESAQCATWARRLSIVRRFAVWLNVADPRNEVPPDRPIGGRRRRNPPHIYTDAELEQLMAEASRLPSRRKLRAYTYETLIGLLATTGLRPGEALALAPSDVDLQGGVLLVRESKFGKSRYVPIHDSTRIALSGYAKSCDELSLQLQATTFFVAESGLPLEASTVRRTFAKVSVTLGLRTPGVGLRVGRGPRLQDFRHTFATRRLVKWYDPAWKWSVSCPNSPLTLGIRTSRTPTGISRPIRNCSSLRRSSCAGGVQELKNERFEITVARSAVLHRPIARTTRRKCAHHSSLSRHVPRVVPVRSRDLGASSLQFAHRGPRRFVSWESFLEHLESGRSNCTWTRNNRLSALRAFFRYGRMKGTEGEPGAERPLPHDSAFP